MTLDLRYLLFCAMHLQAIKICSLTKNKKYYQNYFSKNKKNVGEAASFREMELGYSIPSPDCNVFLNETFKFSPQILAYSVLIHLFQGMLSLYQAGISIRA